MRKVWIGLTAAMVLSTTTAFADGELEPVRARFTTIQSDVAVWAAACRITTKVRAGERTRPLDVRFLDGRCSTAMPDDAIPVTVSIVARDARRDVVIELTPSPDVTPEDARTAVTQFGSTLRTLVRDVPDEVPTAPITPEPHGMSGGAVAAVVLGTIGVAVLVGFLVAGVAALGNGLKGLGNMNMGFGSGGW